MPGNDSTLKIAIVHYHLKPGGVTRVIENTVEALREHPVEIVVLSGEPYQGDHLRIDPATSNLRGVLTIPNLGYTLPNEKPDAGALTYSMRKAAREMLGREPDLWHFHNHSLGKNSAMPGCARRIAFEKAGVLFQIHDFAEDGRPDNWQKIQQTLANPRYLYPLGPHVHYAVLNSRDLGILRAAGLEENHTHLLPNPIPLPPTEEQAWERSPADFDLRTKLGSPDRLVTYPTRAIRRKNIGEFLYWAAAAQEGHAYATTLEPANPEWRPVYDRWVEFARENNLPAHFAIGESSDDNPNPPAFGAIVGAADALLTTSVAEGFGLAFLEPWTFGRPLLGRDLPDITSGFKEHGIDLTHLYDRLDVPLDLVGADLLRQKLHDALIDYYKDYGRTLGNDGIDRAWDSIVRGDAYADFGRLDEELQENVLRGLLANRDLLPKPLDIAPAQEKTQANAHIITDQFNLAAYGERLYRLYTSIVDSPRSELDSLAPDALLPHFMDPARFSLLRA